VGVKAAGARRPRCSAVMDYYTPLRCKSLETYAPHSGTPAIPETPSNHLTNRLSALQAPGQSLRAARLSAHIT
jgi:hypothetical protein